MATHSSISAWRIRWTEEPGWLEFVGCKESDTTEHTHINNKYLFSSYSLPDIFLHDFSILFHLIFKLYDVSTLLYLFTDKEK